MRTVTGALLVSSVSAANWAVITAGSKSFSNYRHQADACHAYQVVKAKGVPEENIILMMYDDVATSSSNPFPGKLFNKPDPTGKGSDVYAGCNIDYRGADVTPEKFMAVIQGDASAGGKVLQSTDADNVFMFFSDHGAPGLIAFPNDVLHVAELQQSFQTMSDNKMFKKLVFYLETCESGSMFQGLSVPNVYALSAANPTESSWGTYCGSEAMVDNTNVGSCLGDLFSVAWMEDADGRDVTQYTLQEEFSTIAARVTKSEVMQWGDVSFVGDKVSNFLGANGYGNGTIPEVTRTKDANTWKTKDQEMKMLLRRYQHAKTGEERLRIAAELQKELDSQVAVEQVHRKIAAIAYPGDTKAQKRLRRRQEKPGSKSCELGGHRALKRHCSGKFDAESGFALWFHQVIVNLCHDIDQGLKMDLKESIEIACTGGMGDALV